MKYFSFQYTSDVLRFYMGYIQYYNSESIWSSIKQYYSPCPWSIVLFSTTRYTTYTTLATRLVLDVCIFSIILLSLSCLVCILSKYYHIVAKYSAPPMHRNFLHCFMWSFYIVVLLCMYAFVLPWRSLLLRFTCGNLLLSIGTFNYWIISSFIVLLCYWWTC